MPNTDDRHRGRRENVWFPVEEHDAMLAAMVAIKESNKSNFIRSAVKNFVAALEKREEQ